MTEQLCQVMSTSYQTHCISFGANVKLSKQYYKQFRFSWLMSRCHDKDTFTWLMSSSHMMTPKQCQLGIPKTKWPIMATVINNNNMSLMCMTCVMSFLWWLHVTLMYKVLPIRLVQNTENETFRIQKSCKPYWHFAVWVQYLATENQLTPAD